MLKKCLKEFAPDTSQGRLFLKVAGVLAAFAAGCHLIMFFTEEVGRSNGKIILEKRN